MLLDIPLGRGTIKGRGVEGAGRARAAVPDGHQRRRQTRRSIARSRAGCTAATDDGLRQEIILGIGGVRVLRALGIHPSVFHANEGHSSSYFSSSRERRSRRHPLDEALRRSARTPCSRPHPVEAGHDVFAEEMIAEYFSSYWPQLGVDRERFMDFARVPGHTGGT